MIEPQHRRVPSRLSGPGRPDSEVDFFISYNAADRAWAEWIAWQLEDSGYTTVLQAWDFRPGANFVLAMQHVAQAERTIAIPGLPPGALHATRMGRGLRPRPDGREGLAHSGARGHRRRDGVAPADCLHRLGWARRGDCAACPSGRGGADTREADGAAGLSWGRATSPFSTAPVPRERGRGGGGRAELRAAGLGRRDGGGYLYTRRARITSAGRGRPAPSYVGRRGRGAPRRRADGRERGIAAHTVRPAGVRRTGATRIVGAATCDMERRALGRRRSAIPAYLVFTLAGALLADMLVR